MPRNWYTGIWPVERLNMRIKRLRVIHANAFNSTAFVGLTSLRLIIAAGDVSIDKEAFKGLRTMHVLGYEGSASVHFPPGLFDAISVSIEDIVFKRWPCDVNMNSMFGNETFRMLTVLHIANVGIPQANFRRLTAANFTSFRRLSLLLLIDCGIEVIEQNAFDAIGRTLKFIKLSRNWIKIVNVEMFRIFFESGISRLLHITVNREPFTCNCALRELYVMQCPMVFKNAKVDCILCMTSANWNDSICDIRRLSNVSKFIQESHNISMMLMLSIRMAWQNHALRIDTKISNRFRILFVDLSAMTRNSTCMDRVTANRHKCWIVNKVTDRLDLHGIDEVRDAELISITAIPVLYNFGARPMHSMMVRRDRAAGYWTCIGWAAVGIVVIILGTIFGFSACICVKIIVDHCYVRRTQATSEDFALEEECGSAMRNTEKVNKVA